MIFIKKEYRVSFRITEEEWLMFNEISAAVLEPWNLSETFRLMISREYVALRKQGLINGGCYEPGF